MNYTAAIAKIKAQRGKPLDIDDNFASIAPFLYEKTPRDFVKAFAENLQNGLWAQKLWPQLGLLDKREPFRRVLGTEIDLRNILWLYRLKKYHGVSGHSAYAFLVPVSYRLNREETEMLAHAADTHSFAGIVAAGTYGGVFKSLLHLQNGEAEILRAVRLVFKKESRNGGLVAVCGGIYERHFNLIAQSE